MRLVYIPEDRFLSINGTQVHNVAVPPDLPPNLHAIQSYPDGSVEPEWNGEPGELPPGFMDTLVAYFNAYTEDKVYVFEMDGRLIASKTRGHVPDGTPFVAVSSAEVPDAPVETWEVDFSSPDGIGGQI